MHRLHLQVACRTRSVLGVLCLLAVVTACRGEPDPQPQINLLAILGPATLEIESRGDRLCVWARTPADRTAVLLPPDLAARADAIVDASGAVVAREGDQVWLGGGDIPVSQEIAARLGNCAGEGNPFLVGDNGVKLEDPLVTTAP